MRQGLSGLSISHGPVNGITAVVLYKGLIRMYLFVPSGPLRNGPWQPCRDLLCLWLLTLAHVWGGKETWNLDFKVLLPGKQTEKMFFLSVFIPACAHWHVFRLVSKSFADYRYITACEPEIIFELTSTWRAAMCCNIFSVFYSPIVVSI